MVGRGDTEYLPLHSRAPSPSGSNWTRSGKQLPVQEAPPTVNPKLLDYRKQTWSLLVPQTFRWLGTVLGSGLLVSVFRIYERKGNFTPHDKNVFNVIVTALSVGVGINFFVRLAIVTGSAGHSAYCAAGSLQRVCQRFAIGEFWPTKDTMSGRST